MIRRVLASLALIAATFGSATAAAQTPQSGNLIFNSSFEEGMYHVSMSNFIANGWSYWYQGRGADDTRGFWMPEPEYGIISDGPGQAHNGNKSQRWVNIWAIHNAGGYQLVKVPTSGWL